MYYSPELTNETLLNIQNQYPELKSNAALSSLISATKSAASDKHEIVQAFEGHHNAFIRIIEKECDDGVFLFGSKVKARFYKEIQVCKAKKCPTSGTWLPDETHLLAKAMITDYQLSSAVFNSTSYTGYPITFNSLFNSSVKVPNHVFIDSHTQYNGSTSSVRKKASDAYLELISELELFQNSNVKFTKANIKKALTAIKTLRLILINNNSHSFELMCEALLKDAQNINAEVISNIIAKISRLAYSDNKHLENQNKDNFDVGRFGNLEELYLSSFIAEMALPLLKELDELDIEKNESFSALLSHYEEILSQGNRTTHHCSAYGLIKFSKPSGSFNSMFGCSGFEQSCVKISFSLGRAELKSSNQIQYDYTSELLSLCLSDMQMMEMLTGSRTALWVKASVSRIFNKAIYINNAESSSDIKLKEAEELPSEKSIENTLCLLSEELSSCGGSKSKREKIMQIGEQLEPMLDIYLDEREEQLNSESNRIKHDVMELEQEKISTIVKNISNNHPEVLNVFGDVNIFTLVKSK